MVDWISFCGAKPSLLSEMMRSCMWLPRVTHHMCIDPLIWEDEEESYIFVFRIRIHIPPFCYFLIFRSEMLFLLHSIEFEFKWIFCKSVLMYFIFNIAVFRCKPNPCYNGGICADLGYSYKCSCKKPYSGKRCQG
jgi:hypothetical protein